MWYPMLRVKEIGTCSRWIKFGSRAFSIVVSESCSREFPWLQAIDFGPFARRPKWTSSSSCAIGFRGIHDNRAVGSAPGWVACNEPLPWRGPWISHSARNLLMDTHPLARSLDISAEQHVALSGAQLWRWRLAQEDAFLVLVKLTQPRNAAVAFFGCWCIAHSISIPAVVCSRVNNVPQSLQFSLHWQRQRWFGQSESLNRSGVQCGCNGDQGWEVSLLPAFLKRFWQNIIYQDISLTCAVCMKNLSTSALWSTRS